MYDNKRNNNDFFIIFNKVPVQSWFDDMTDSELRDLIPFFERLSKIDSVYSVLCNSNQPYAAINNMTHSSDGSRDSSL